MKLTLLISVFSLTIGAPFSSTVENEYPDSDEESGDPKENNVDPISFKNIQLDKGCTIAWKIMGESLLLSLKLSRVNKWLVVGFADVDNSLDQLEQTLFLRIRRTKPIAAKVSITFKEHCIKERGLCKIILLLKLLFQTF